VLAPVHDLAALGLKLWAQIPDRLLQKTKSWTGEFENQIKPVKWSVAEGQNHAAAGSTDY
jgi:hypothetical protein